MKSHFRWIRSSVMLLMALSCQPPLFAETAEEFVPCKIVERVKVKFPVRPLHLGITQGEVWLFLEVHTDGRLGDVLPFAHSGRDFANAAVEAIEQWEFMPALLAGEPVRSINTLNVRFEVNGVTAYQRPIGEPQERPTPGVSFEYRPHTLDELDRIPKAISRSSPIYPREWIEQGRIGTVLVDYFIDEEGYTRFPRVIGNPDELLGAATVEAVRTWRFQPPVRRGKPVLARVRQEFNFYPTKREGSP